MLRALGRVASTAIAPLEARGALQAAGPASTLTCLRLFASEPSSSSPDANEKPSRPTSGAGATGASGSGSPRLGGREWRSWIDTKLDSKLEAIGQQGGAATAAAASPQPTVKPARAAPDQPRSKAATGWELEQQIYSIVGQARPTTEDGQFPEGITSYAQLAMAADAPRFARSGANVGEISPQRVHPTRLFFPQQNYAPTDLDPYRTTEEGPPPWEQPSAGPVLNPDEVTQLADYKNAPVLSTFLSEAGKLPLRARTHLRAKLHRHLARQVKTARHMAILSPTARWEPAVSAKDEAAALRRQQQRQRRQRQ